MSIAAAWATFASENVLQRLVGIHQEAVQYHAQKRASLK